MVVLVGDRCGTLPFGDGVGSYSQLNLDGFWTFFEIELEIAISMYSKKRILAYQVPDLSLGMDRKENLGKEPRGVGRGLRFLDQRS